MRKVMLFITCVYFLSCCSLIDRNNKVDCGSALLSSLESNSTQVQCLDYERVLTTFIRDRFCYPSSKKELIRFYKNRQKYYNQTEEDRRIIRFLHSRRISFLINESNCSCSLFDREGFFANVVGTPCLWNRMENSPENYYYHYSYPVFFDDKGCILYDLCMENLADEKSTGPFIQGLENIIITSKDIGQAVIQDFDSKTVTGRVSFYLKYKKDGQLSFLCDDCASCFNLHLVYRNGTISSERVKVADLSVVCASYWRRVTSFLESFCSENPDISQIVFLAPLICL